MSDEVTITCRQTDEIENYQSGWELNEDRQFIIDKYDKYGWF